jgi:hypothetical protein
MGWSRASFMGPVWSHRALHQTWGPQESLRNYLPGLALNHNLNNHIFEVFLKGTLVGQWSMQPRSLGTTSLFLPPWDGLSIACFPSPATPDSAQPYPTLWSPSRYLDTERDRYSWVLAGCPGLEQWAWGKRYRMSHLWTRSYIFTSH